MKITINQYKYNREAHRLKISSSSGNGVDTSVDIDMTNLSFFIDKIPQYLIDMFYLSCVVYGIDRAFDRHKYSIDGWSRIFDVDIKLFSADVFTVNKESIDKMLSFLTGDFWNISFEYFEPTTIQSVNIPELAADFGQVNLFSGGMDSFIGAIDYLAGEHHNKLCLVSQYDHKMPGAHDDQRKAIAAIDQYADKFYHLPSASIFPLTSAEKTCRSRSLIFISMAALVAEYKHVPIEVPENGSVSLNFPLSPSRRAACSTRTTHVLFINQFKALFGALGSPLDIVNPYEFQTKGEMVRNCNNRPLLLAKVAATNSCGKRNMKQHMTDRHASHCGRCMPCMYRRAALVGLEDTYQDPTTYGDTFGQLFNACRKQKVDDFFAMLNYLHMDLSDDDIRRELRIAGLGKLQTFERYVQLVKNTRMELKAMIAEQQNCDAVKRYIGLI